MRKNYGQDNEKIATYVEDIFKPEDSFLKNIRSIAEKAGLPPIHVAPMDGLHLEVLAAAMGASKVVEIGTLAGYSAIRMLRGMERTKKNNLEFHSFELDPKHAKIAEENIQSAGFASIAKVWVGSALENLSRIENRAPFDLVFIDADKANYINYFHWAAKNLRSGGVLLADNCFAFGDIANTEFDHPNTKKIVESLQEFNAAVARSSQFCTTMIPTGEGLLMACKL